MDKLDPMTDGASLDVLQENIAKLKQIFPDVFSEDKIDFDSLKETLGEYIDGKEERYSFTWHGKSQAKRIAQTSSTGTLRPCKEESKNWDTTENLFIEGDNLEILKLLQKSYHKKVKMIYIDPPYNTGGDFIYPDNFKDNIKNYLDLTGQTDEEGRKLRSNPETSGRYHTDWLNMMYPRLKLARNLLRDDGVIFVSIDDYEIGNLRRVMDEIFGEDNLLNNRSFIWHIPDGTNKGFIARAHEYVLGYAKSIKDLIPFKRPPELSAVSKERCTNAPSKGNPTTEITFNKGLRHCGSDCLLEGIIGDKEPIEIVGKLEFKDGKLVADTALKSSWRNRDQIIEYMEKGEAYDEKGQKINEIYFEENGKPKYVKELIYYSPKSVQQFKDGNGVLELVRSTGFSNPKPVKMMSFLAALLLDEDDIILDFFAGSGTVSHAIFDLVSKTNMAHKSILVQLPESIDPKENPSAFNFCQKLGLPAKITEVGKERIRRAGEKILEENKGKLDFDESKLDVGFKVFKLDTSNIVPWDGEFDSAEQDLFDAVDNIKSDRSEEDILYEILLKYGLDLTLPIEERMIEGKKVYILGLGALVICLDKDISIETVEGIGKLKEELNPEIMRVVFKDSGFKDDVVKTNAIQILKRYEIEDVKSL